jgi:acyl dehydratase
VRTFDRLGALLAAPPLDLGRTGWVEVDPADVDRFERATGGPPSGYLALALTNRFLPDLMAVPAAARGVNYGAESVCFGPTLRSGDRVRAAARLVAAVEVGGGVQTEIDIALEVEGGPEPACRVRSLSRWLA